MMRRRIDCAKRVIKKIWNTGSRGSYGLYHLLELPNHEIKFFTIGNITIQGKPDYQNRTSGRHYAYMW